MSAQKVLVSGAGIAGGVLAYWLAKYDFIVTVVERAGPDQKLGQTLEIEEPALQVVEAMGLVDTFKALKTAETGFQLVDQNGRPQATMGAGAGPTGALELMRGDLCSVFCRAADESPHVRFLWHTTVKTLQQSETKATVELENRKNGTTMTEDFDLVIAADGARSRTRSMVMGSPEELNCFKPVGAFVAYFSIPKEEQDWPHSRACHYPGRRLLWLRPMGKNSQETSANFIHLSTNSPALREASRSGDRDKQKQAMAELYKGLGWEAPRVIEQMMTSQNFYMEELEQIKLKTWSKGRFVLLGDSAWAPTPFTGAGNQLAIIGAWILAQELSRDRSPSAFVNYEKRFRAYVEDAQALPLGGMVQKLALPSSAVGIWTVRKIIGTIAAVVRMTGTDKEASSSDAKTPAVNTTKKPASHAILQMEQSIPVMAR